jgi:hypothetical protein
LINESLVVVEAFFKKLEHFRLGVVFCCGTKPTLRVTAEFCEGEYRVQDAPISGMVQVWVAPKLLT